MRPKRGNELPKMGNSLHLDRELGGGTYEQAIADALRRELGGSHKAVKTLMRWTGASARTTKNWFTGSAGPNGHYLIQLMRNSDAVFQAVLVLTGRQHENLVPAKMAVARGHLAELLALIDRSSSP